MRSFDDIRVEIIGEPPHDAGWSVLQRSWTIEPFNGAETSDAPDCLLMTSANSGDVAAARMAASIGVPAIVVSPEAHTSDLAAGLARSGIRQIIVAPVSDWDKVLQHRRASRAAAPLRAVVERTTAEAAVLAPLDGTLREGDVVCEARAGLPATVRRVERYPDRSLAVHLDPEVALAPGDVLCPVDERPEVADQFAARLHWLANTPLIAGRPYRITVGGKSLPGSVTAIKHRVADDASEPLAARTLRAGETGVVNLSLRSPVAFDLTETSGRLRRVLIEDPSTGALLGRGVLEFALRRAANIHWQTVAVGKAERSTLKSQTPVLVWFTGLSGSGKSTIANLLEARLLAEGRHTYLLDGDNVRHGLNRDLGFTDADRVENVRRVAEVGKLMVDAGLIVLASFISPFRAERALARDLVGEGEFVEVFVDAPLAVAEARDPKGLYRRARRGELRNFTGIDSPYEPPEAPEIRLDTSDASAEALADRLFMLLAERGHLAS